MLGTRSEQSGMAQGVPSDMDHLIAPVLAFSPYTQSFSVATITVEPITSGWAYTWPLTAVENTSPNWFPATTGGLRFGSLGSHPVRSLFSDAVVSLCGVTCEAVATSPAGTSARTAATTTARNPACGIGPTGRELVPRVPERIESPPVA